MKKTFLALSLLSVFAFTATAQAGVERVAGDWQLNSDSPVVFTCGANDYPHTFDSVVMGEEGAFTGTGSADTQAGYYWDAEGSISGDSITFTITYTGNNPGYTLTLDGTIAEDGSVSGTSSGNCQTFDMPADSASNFTGNHGQYVRSAVDKKAAAHSRVGMPAKSKGHTK